MYVGTLLVFPVYYLKLVLILKTNLKVWCDYTEAMQKITQRFFWGVLTTFTTRQRVLPRQQHLHKN